MKTARDNAEKIKEISGANPQKCMKCGKCSATCPAFNEMDIKPHQFVSYVAEENIDALMQSETLWKCLSCFACVERCPRDVKPGKLIDAARQMVVRQRGADYLKAEEKQNVQKVLDRMIRKSKNVILPETPDERFLFGFTTLFFEKRPISIQRTAEKLFVSKTAMLQTKKEIQDACRWYHGLTIEVSSKGSRITGPEKIRRHALAEIMNYYTYGAILMERVITFLFGSEKYEDYIALYKALPAILQQYGYRLIDKAIEGFALDIFVSLMRREKGFELEEDAGDYETWPCVEEICRFLEKKEYDIPKQERSYMAECLRAKRILYTQGKTYEVPEEYTEITKEFLEIVDRKYHTDYRNNEELFTRLSVHIGKMIERIEQGYFETNPTLENVLEYYEREVRMAEELNQILRKKVSIYSQCT